MYPYPLAADVVLATVFFSSIRCTRLNDWVSLVDFGLCNSSHFLVIFIPIHSFQCIPHAVVIFIKDEGILFLLVSLAWISPEAYVTIFSASVYYMKPLSLPKVVEDLVIRFNNLTSMSFFRRNQEVFGVCNTVFNFLLKLLVLENADFSFFYGLM